MQPVADGSENTSTEVDSSGLGVKAGNTFVWESCPKVNSAKGACADHSRVCVDSDASDQEVARCDTRD